MGKPYVDISEITKDINIEDISSVLKKYEEIHLLDVALKKYLKELENMIKLFMKERKWNRYKDKSTKISVELDSIEDRTVDVKMLKVIVTEEQMSKLVKKKMKERIEIITKDKLARLVNYGKGKNKK